MWARLRPRRPSHAVVVAYLALFFAVGGGTAAALTGSNTVFSDDITNDQVRSADVRNDNLTGGGLTSPDIRPNAVKGNDVDESTLGLVPNASSLDGRSASSFVANSTYTLGQGQERAGNALGDGTKVLSQSCLAGDRLLSGGPASVNAASRVLDSFAQSTSTWQARINDSAVSGGDSFTVLVLCANQ